MPTLGSSYLAGPTVVAWGEPKGWAICRHAPRSPHLGGCPLSPPCLLAALLPSLLVCLQRAALWGSL